MTKSIYAIRTMPVDFGLGSWANGWIDDLVDEAREIKEEQGLKAAHKFLDRELKVMVTDLECPGATSPAVRKIVDKELTMKYRTNEV